MDDVWMTCVCHIRVQARTNQSQGAASIVAYYKGRFSAALLDVFPDIGLKPLSPSQSTLLPLSFYCSFIFFSFLPSFNSLMIIISVLV